MTERGFEQDGKTPPLKIEEGALMGELVEEDVQHEIEKTLNGARQRLATTLSLVMAQRILENPEEEMRQSDIIRQARERVAPRDGKPGKSSGV
jgi:hypothetical protein